ncbi:MAG: site-specific DNA-methyltransferase [Alphaproteobacteria bacterium]|nr:site-specific DNA-methyltransferase [Alphaproteobacteria bacterium]
MANAEKQRDRLVALLSDLFQLNQPDLDFGFYRIMHAKADRVSSFLQNDLLKIIKDAFGEADDKRVEEVRLAYEAAIKQAKDFGAPNPEETEPVKKAKAAYDAVRDAGNGEGEVYDHLYRFFERYYDNGDFMSRRYYARETDGKAAPYSVPYDGREVYLHWANRDQYYIKTSDYLTNFTFNLANAPELKGLFEQEVRKVHCRIVEAAEGEHGNIKTTDKTERYFLIHQEEPIKLENGDIVIQFEYRPDAEKTGQGGKWQEKRIDEAEKSVMDALKRLKEADVFVAPLATMVGNDGNRTLLRRYLNQYTSRNTMDYFIHKDLGGFMRRELDFYIKNEIMRLDDIESADVPRVDFYLSKIKVLRKISHHLIDFLAQLEDFQKKIWLKKKFVVETNYCITLDRVPENLYPEIAANDKQREEWVKLFAIDDLKGGKKPLSVAFLKENPFLVLDTALFGEAFKTRLLAEIQDLDEKLNGLLIHSENFQALTLLERKHVGQVGLCHIDPPYNTQTSGFLYKNSYQHSSWMAMMENRISLTGQMLSQTGSFLVHIDENEYEHLYNLFGSLDLADTGTLIWDKKNPILGRRGVATQHEYILSRSKNVNPVYLRNDSIQAMLAKRDELFKEHGEVNSVVRNEYSTWVSSNQKLSGGEKQYKYIDDLGQVYRGVAMGAPEKRTDPKFFIPLIHPKTKKPCPLPPNGWSRTPEKLKELIAQGNILFGVDETTQPQKKVVLTEESQRQLPSVIQDGRSGKSDLDSLGLSFPYSHPLTMYKTLIGSSFCIQPIVLDYFGGSGTTAHAVIDLNREDSEKRKYILVEMGDHFDSVMLPRIKKAIYTKNWDNGRPISYDGVSHCFKYMRLESYEDALNNLTFREDAMRNQALTKNDEFRRDYMLKYWLDFETKGSPSLLSVQQFADPTAYMLNIKKPGSDEYVEKSVDLIETFNWLIGLHVDHIDAPRIFGGKFKREADPELPNDQTTRLILDGKLAEDANGKWWFRKVEGRVCRTPGDKKNMDKVLIIWRKLTDNLEEDNLMLDEWFKKYRLSTQDSEFDVIYVNGSNNLPNLKRTDENWKVCLIEEAFHQKMWDVEG